MSDANTATYDVRGPVTEIADITRRTGFRSLKQSASRAYPIDTTRSAENQPFSDSAADRQVREDRDFYIPNFLTDEHFESHPELHVAAAEHASDLRRAERYLDEVFNLVQIMRASFEDDGDSRAMQAETILKIIEKKLNKANNRIDKHDSRHTNLFLAYFDLKGKSEGSEDDSSA